MTLLIAAGGTGGHLYPGIAVAQALRSTPSTAGQASRDVQFVVRRGDLGKGVLEREGFPVHEISGQGLPRQLHPRLLSFPFRLAAGWGQAAALLNRLRPTGVLGMGGYITFPVLATARLRGCFTMIHEQNVLPGMSNRLLAPLVHRIAVSFEESLARFPPNKAWVSGLPIRAEIGKRERMSARKALGIETEGLLFLVFGGSLGAKRLNQVVVEAWSHLQTPATPFQVLHITGERHLETVVKLYHGSPTPVRLLAYCHQMADAYAAADLVISRSGASTVAEIAATGRPAILVPYPYASGNHQLFNAQVLSKTGQAIVLEESTLTGPTLADAVRKLLEHLTAVKSTAFIPDAAQRLAQALITAK